MSCYIDLAVDVTALSQFDKIKEISDLVNAILAEVWILVIKKMLHKQHMKERAIHLKLINIPE